MYCRENGNATRGAVELRAEMPNEINTIQNAWNVICEFEYLVEADHSARKGKRYRAEAVENELHIFLCGNRMKPLQQLL